MTSESTSSKATMRCTLSPVRASENDWSSSSNPNPLDG